MIMVESDLGWRQFLTVGRLALDSPSDLPSEAWDSVSEASGVGRLISWFTV